MMHEPGWCCCCGGGVVWMARVRLLAGMDCGVATWLLHDVGENGGLGG